MAVSKKAKALYFKIFEGTETWMANAIMSFQVRRSLKKAVRHMPQLSSAQKKEVRAFWKPYYKVDTDWVRYYTAITGKFDPRYIPNDLQYTKIDQYFNQRRLGYGFNDKNYYSLIFPDIKQPKTVVRKIGGLIFDEQYHLIDIQKAVELLREIPEVIVKPSQESGSGRDIRFYDTQNDVDKLKEVLLNKDEKNLIVQDIVKQHIELAKMHPQSLNTVRVYTLMMEDGVHVLSVTMRMGANASRIDNGSAKAGIFTGVDPFNGRLMDYAYNDMLCGERTDRHPGGMLLNEINVPSLDKMLDTAKRAAQYTGNFRLVGWDFSASKDGEVILIEANMRKGAIGPIQCLHGPFYGELTKKVLNEVFNVNGKL